MDDTTKTIIKFAAVGVGAYILYNWLQTSGLWAQWFGGNSFTTPQALLTYCQANPNGTAIYVGQNGVPTSAPCSQWVAANTASGAVQPAAAAAAPPAAAAPAASTTTTAAAAPAPAPTGTPAAGSTLTQQLTAAAAKNVLMASGQGTVSDWNYLLTQLFPNAPQITNATPAGDANIGVSQYVTYYLGLFPDPTLGGGAGVSGYEEPYQWMN